MGTGNTKITGTVTITGAVTGTSATIDPNAAAGGALTISNSATQTSAELVKITGTAGQTALQVAAGDVDIQGDTTITGVITHTKDTESTSKTSGALICSGGIGIAKNIHVGGTADVTGAVTITGDLGGVNGAFSGTLTQGGNNVVTSSDRRFKRNITALTGGLETIKALRPVRYFYRTEEFPERNFAEAPQVGFIAQEVEEVLPQVVDADFSGYRSLRYGQVTPVLVDAMKEQVKEIAGLRAGLAQLQADLLAQQEAHRREMAELRALLNGN